MVVTLFSLGSYVQHDIAPMRAAYRFLPFPELGPRFWSARCVHRCRHRCHLLSIWGSQWLAAGCTLLELPFSICFYCCRHRRRRRHRHRHRHRYSLRVSVSSCHCQERSRWLPLASLLMALPMSKAFRSLDIQLA